MRLANTAGANNTAGLHVAGVVDAADGAAFAIGETPCEDFVRPVGRHLGQDQRPGPAEGEVARGVGAAGRQPESGGDAGLGVLGREGAGADEAALGGWMVSRSPSIQPSNLAQSRSPTDPRSDK